MSRLNSPSRQIYQIYRPSVYSMGIERPTPYAPGWVEGMEYGAWYDYNPLMVAVNFLRGEDPYTADAEKLATSVKAGVASAQAQYQVLMEAEESKKREEERKEARKKALRVAAAFGSVGLGMGSLVLLARYIRRKRMQE